MEAGTSPTEISGHEFFEVWVGLGRHWWNLMHTTPAMRQEVLETIEGMVKTLNEAEDKLLEIKK